MRRPNSRNASAALLILLPLLFLFRPLFQFEAFLPAGQLQHVQPWHSATPVPWNVLQFDGIIQFYPWRLEAARQWRSGKVPLGNPHAFAGDGGAPLLANSQSAPFYPPNLIFTLAGPSGLWYAFGLSAALHLILLGKGVHRLARTLGLERAPATLSAVATTFSAPIVAWLSLPTLLCVVAWFPWLLWAIRKRRPVATGVFAAMTLLGGHLQVAFYVLGFGAAFALWEAFAARPRFGRATLGVCLAGGLAVSLAAPQLLPTLQMGRISHRGGVAATAEGYSAYNANAVPLRHAATLLLPDTFGNPSRNNGITWIFNRDGVPNNYAEWAMYFGVAPWILALSALMVPWKRSDVGVLKERRFLATATGLAVLMAFGSPINAVLYYGVPGFAATGNPGRVLGVAVVFLGLLAGIGLQELRKRPFAMAIGTAVVLQTATVVSAVAFARMRSLSLPDLVTLALPGLLLSVTWLVLTIYLGTTRLKPQRAEVAAWGMVILAAIDLLAWGWDYNRSSPRDEVFRETPGIVWLKENAPNDLIACLNSGWSIAQPGPGAAPFPPVLPPNALTVFGLHDLGGYDSLILRETKDRIREATGEDPSPPENGNMVFVKTVQTARALGARFIVMPPSDGVPNDPTIQQVYRGPDLMVYEAADGWNLPPVSRNWATATFGCGVFLFAVGGAVLAGIAGYRKRK